MIPKIQLYAKSLKPLLDWVQENPDDKDIKYTINRLLRYYTNSPKELGIPYLYSKAALTEAKNLGIPDPVERLSWTTWKEQCHKRGLQDEGRVNGIFHLEHITPVSQIAKELNALTEITEELIYDILVNNFKIAWILKTEQKILDSVNRSGVRIPSLLTNLNIFIKGFNH
jgi:hypothetical protein